MNKLKLTLAAATGILAASAAFAGANEDATLNATVTAGALEIVSTSVNGPWTPTGGSVAVTGSNQSDALQFNLTGITVNDLNGDGLGWKLTATPDATLSDGASGSLARGTVGGFSNSSDGGAVVSTGTTTGDTLTYASGSGIAGLTVDYDVAYDVPAFATAGSYTGVVAFAIVAQ